jgi:hypothetical protein
VEPQSAGFEGVGTNVGMWLRSTISYNKLLFPTATGKTTHLHPSGIFHQALDEPPYIILASPVPI